MYLKEYICWRYSIRFGRVQRSIDQDKLRSMYIDDSRKMAAFPHLVHMRWKLRSCVHIVVYCETTYSISKKYRHQGIRKCNSLRYQDARSSALKHSNARVSSLRIQAVVGS
jgi:hypothetical protein